MTVRRAIAVTAVAVALGAAPGGAAGEEGLFVTRLAGGVSTVHPDTPAIGQLWSASADLSLTERSGLIGGAHWTVHDEATTLGMGLGVRRLLVERFWRRLYVHAGPELVLVWRDGAARAWDVGLRGGLGYEQLFMWGFGFVVELSGSATAGRGDRDSFDASSVGMTAGLFMEF